MSVRNLLVATTAFCIFGSAAYGDALNMTTVNYPLAYMAERIGGDLVEATYPGPSDEDPAFWEPEPGEITAMQEADIIVLNGATYAKWAKNASLPRAKTVTTTADLRDRLIETEQEAHSHGEGDEHSHGGTAFTTWLDFDIAAEQAMAISTFLKRQDPDNAEAYEAGVNALRADLAALDTRAKAVGTKFIDRPVLASHPIYQYFGAAYGIPINSLTWEPGLHPTAEEWAEFDVLQASTGSNVMLWEGEPAPETRARLEEMGVEIVLFSQQSAGAELSADDVEEGEDAFLSYFRAVLDALDGL